MQFLEPKLNSIERIDSIISKHRQSLNNYLDKNKYSFCFVNSTEEPYFNITIFSEESHGGNCWTEDSSYSEYTFNKHKLIQPLILFISTIIIKTNSKELKKIANYVVNSLKKKEFVNSEYYGNYTKGTYFTITLDNLINKIELYQNEKI